MLLYLHQTVIDGAGGMNTAHGIFSGEHVEYSGRVHAAGLTRWPFADVTGSEHIWWARDRAVGNTHGSSFTLAERRRLHSANGIHWDRRWPGWPWFPYREGQCVRDYGLGPRIADDDRGLLAHVLSLRPHGTALEFGVGEGHTLRMIAERMTVVGFDSFVGLPEGWRPEYPKGAFACKPPMIANSTLVIGPFADTLPTSTWPEQVGLVHIDCDLYSSTRTVLTHIEPVLQPGTYVVFDEYHGYEGHEDGEMKAWREFADRSRIGWTVIGHGREQWAIRIV